MIDYGTAIKRIRTQLGIRQSETARKSGLSASYLSLVENGKTIPSHSALERIANAMGVPHELVIWEAIEPPDELKPEQKQAFFIARAITADYLQSVKRAKAQNEL